MKDIVLIAHPLGAGEDDRHLQQAEFELLRGCEKKVRRYHFDTHCVIAADNIASTETAAQLASLEDVHEVSHVTHDHENLTFSAIVEHLDLFASTCGLVVAPPEVVRSIALAAAHGSPDRLDAIRNAAIGPCEGFMLSVDSHRHLHHLERV